MSPQVPDAEGWWWRVMGTGHREPALVLAEGARLGWIAAGYTSRQPLHAAQWAGPVAPPGTPFSDVDGQPRYWRPPSSKVPDAPGWWWTDDPYFSADGWVMLVIDSGVGLVAEVLDQHIAVETISAWRGRVTRP